MESPSNVLNDNQNAPIVQPPVVPLIVPVASLPPANTRSVTIPPAIQSTSNQPVAPRRVNADGQKVGDKLSGSWGRINQSHFCGRKVQIFACCTVKHCKTLKMQAVRQSVATLGSAVGRRTYKVPAYWRQATMNDMPVPRGDFFELEAQRVKKYNTILFVGLAMSATALGIATQTDLIELHLSPPKTLD